MKQTSLHLTVSLVTLLTLTACSQEPNQPANLIATIPEASGIDYCKESNTLIVANDEGTYYEITPQGAIIATQKLGNYDLEGVVCEEELMVFAVEKGELLVVPRSEPKINRLKLKGQGYKLTKKAGIEGITKIGNHYYLSIQSKEKKNAKLLKVKLGANHAKVVEVIEHGIIDSAGLSYFKKKLYIVSDKKDKLYVYDLKRHKILKRVKLPKFAQEGVTFDDKGDIYFANDNGAVMRYSLKELGL
jgi:uncharacterized protein YjiK